MSIYELHDKLHKFGFQSKSTFDLRFIDNHSITIYIDTYQNWIYFYDRTNEFYARFDSVQSTLNFIQTYQPTNQPTKQG